ncbi:MAG: hypothetical protein JXC85_00190 [Candidatus Aenigmarchaeota archaeon]|nr:hypothetical protein [Candidatus Aenigmarchaeota archaeon]
MFEISQDVLILLLVALGAALALIVILILRKQRQIKRLHEEEAGPGGAGGEGGSGGVLRYAFEDEEKGEEQVKQKGEEKDKQKGKGKVKGKEKEKEGKPDQAETGPTDLESIKASIMPGASKRDAHKPAGKGKEAGEPAEEAVMPEKPEHEEERPPAPFGEEEIQPVEDAGVEEGVDLDHAGDMMKAFPAVKAAGTPPDEARRPAKKAQAKGKRAAEEPGPQDEIEYVDLDEYEESMDEQAEKAEKAKHAGPPLGEEAAQEEKKAARPKRPEDIAEVPEESDEERYGPAKDEGPDVLATPPAGESPEFAPAPSAVQKEEPPESPEPGKPPEPAEAPAEAKEPGDQEPPVEAKPQMEKPPEPPSESSIITTADLSQSPKDFIGKSVTMEGIIKLSSRGRNDVWYVLFDDTGSAVVRSRQDIPSDKVRIFAEIKETRLGQTYLDVLKYEDA